MLKFLRRHFLTGLVAITPLALTSWILWRFYILIDATVQPWLARIPTLSEAYPDFILTVIGVLLLILLITVVGLFTRNLIGIAFFSLLERFFKRIPVVKSVFSAVQQIATVLLQDQRRAFEKVVVFPYPRDGLYSLGFVTSDEEGADLITVFLPTAPNPTSGFMLLVPRGEARVVDIPVEEAIKLAVSGGSIMTTEQVTEISNKITLNRSNREQANRVDAPGQDGDA